MLFTTKISSKLVIIPDTEPMIRHNFALLFEITQPTTMANIALTNV